jgi:Lrp/AsnC family transcriptional regulator, leucine-responsive regulatory protein
MERSLDRFDIALLNKLQEDNLSTAEMLTEAVPLSPSAITRRIRRLREEGFIAADVAILSPRLVAHRLKALVHIQLHDHAPEGRLVEFRGQMKLAPEVQFLVEISGVFDMLAIIVVSDMAAFNIFADTVLASHAAVRRYETSFVKKEFKNSWAIALDERDVG